MAVSEKTVGTIRPDFQFLNAIQEHSGQAVSSCYRCLKCTGGCPMAEEMDYPPDKLVRMVQLGLKETALRSKAIWLCTGCVTCSERCPNGIDVARVIDSLKQMAMEKKLPAGEQRIVAFHESFLGTVKQYGRLHEATMIALLKLKTRDLMSDVGVGLKLFLKGKIPPLPQRIRGRAEVAGLFDVADGRHSKPGSHGGAK